MCYLDELRKRLADEEKKEKITLENVSQLRFSELEKRNMAIEIYSDVLGCTFWLCSNELMALDVAEKNPGAVCYTTAEMRELLKVNPSPEYLRALHNIKSVFNTSKVIPL